MYSIRWLTPAAQDVALHALVCLLRAAEVDVCGHMETDTLDAGGGRVLDSDNADGGRAVLMKDCVLLLILRTCAMFQDHDGVVKACCMLMRVGVQCSLSDGGPKVRSGLMLMHLVLHPLQYILCVVVDALIILSLPLFVGTIIGQTRTYQMAFRPRSPSTILIQPVGILVAERTTHFRSTPVEHE